MFGRQDKEKNNMLKPNCLTEEELKELEDYLDETGIICEVRDENGNLIYIHTPSL